MEKNPQSDKSTVDPAAEAKAEALLTEKMAKSGIRAKRSYTPVIAVLALILAIIALLLSDVDVKRLKFHEDQTVNRVKTTQQLFDEQQQVVSQLQQQFTELKKVQQHELLQSANNTAGIDRLMQSNSSSHQQWTVAEALHLTKLADYYLKFNHNQKMAIALLDAADQRLSHLGDPSLLNARQMIADTLAELKALPSLDLVGLLVRFNSLQQAIVHLPLITETMNKSVLHASAQSSTVTAPWRQSINDGWQQLQKIIVIRHHTNTANAWLAPDQKNYLIQHVQLLLQQAQWALMQENQQAYNLTLQQAEQLIKQNFDNNDQATQNVMTNLINLQKIDIDPKLPDVSKLVLALQKDQEQATMNTNQNVPVKKLDHGDAVKE